jgi:hypothetical protein
MHALCGSVAALAVASIYYTWRAYFYVHLQNERHLRERIAYMLWMVAQAAD